MATRFVVRNEGATPLVVGSECGRNWLELFQDGAPVGYDATCSCPCEDTNVCGCPAICVNKQELLVPGTSVERSWDGVALDFTTNGCYERHVPKAGTVLDARACWNTHTGTPPVSCNSAQFSYGSDARVVLTAAEEATYKVNTTIIMTNSSAHEIAVRKASCGQQGWFYLDMGERLSIQSFCGCSCTNDFKLASCATCGACLEDEIETLLPGESISWIWDGTFNYRYESGCSASYTMPLAMNVQAKFCWRVPGAVDDICQATVLPPHTGVRTIELNAS